MNLILSKLFHAEWLESGNLTPFFDPLRQVRGKIYTQFKFPVDYEVKINQGVWVMSENGNKHPATTKKLPEDGEIPKELKIPHHRAPNFSSHFATNASITGPTGDGMYHIIFYADVVGLISETARLNEKDVTENEKGYLAGYNTTIELDDTEHFRENKTRITMPFGAILQLRDLLNRIYPVEAKTSENKNAKS